jgi:transposase
LEAVGRRPAHWAEFDRSRIGPSAAATHWRAPTMPNGMRWVGLDVHAHASAVAVFDDVTGEVVTCRVSGRPVEVLGVLRGLPRPVRAVSEAGPTGYGLVRRARAEGIEMAVCSAGNIERRPGDRIKTDRRDAIRLARLFCAGDLRLVWVPSEEQERLRDLVRCRRICGLT